MYVAGVNNQHPYAKSLNGKKSKGWPSFSLVPLALYEALISEFKLATAQNV